MNPWLQAFGYIGIGAVLVAVVNGLFAKRKLSAEATKIITDAASGVVEIQKAEISRMLTSNSNLTQRVEAQQVDVDQLKRAQQRQGEALAIHAFWDNQAVKALGEQGINLPPPPPLGSPPG